MKHLKRFEDVYYEPRGRNVDQKEEIEQIVSDWFHKDGFDQDDWFFYVRYNDGSDIEVGEIVRKGESTKTEFVEQMTKDWERSKDSLITALENEGYHDWEVSFVGPRGFRICMEEK